MRTSKEHEVASQQDALQMNIYLHVCRLAEKARFDVIMSAHGQFEAMLENASEGIADAAAFPVSHTSARRRAIAGKLNLGRKAVDFQAAHKIRSAIRACRCARRAMIIQ